MHLKELHSVLSTNKERVVTIKGQPVINFSRYSLFVKKLKEVLPYPPPDLEQFRQRGELAYLEDKLRNLPLGDEAQDAIYSRAVELQRIESAAKKSRSVQMARLGFKISDWGMKVLGSGSGMGEVLIGEATDTMRVPRVESVKSSRTDPEQSGDELEGNYISGDVTSEMLVSRSESLKAVGMRGHPGLTLPPTTKPDQYAPYISLPM